MAQPASILQHANDLTAACGCAKASVRRRHGAAAGTSL